MARLGFRRHLLGSAAGGVLTVIMLVGAPGAAVAQSAAVVSITTDGDNIVNSGTIASMSPGSTALHAEARAGTTCGTNTVNVTGDVTASGWAILAIGCGSSTVNVQAGQTVSNETSGAVTLWNIAGTTATINIDGTVAAPADDEIALVLFGTSSVTTLGSTGVLRGRYIGGDNGDELIINHGAIWHTAGESDFWTGTDTLANAGTINAVAGATFLNLETLTNSGDINGNVRLESPTGATLINSGSINGSGPIAVSFGGANSSDTVVLLTGSSIAGALDGGGGADSVSLSGTINTATPLQTIGSFLNFESLNVDGGYWTASEVTGSFGSTTINGGTFAVNGSIESPIVVNQATLAGTGMIVGNVAINNGAVLSPGSSIGTLNVAGNLAFGRGSTFRVETTPDGLSDHLAVSGSVTIGSRTSVQVLAGSGNYSPRTSYSILTATGRIVGKFSSVTSDLAFLTPRLTYSTNSIVLTLIRNDRTFTSASTLNDVGTAVAVGTLGEGSAVYEAVLAQSEGGARQAFASLSGSAYGDLEYLLVNDFGHARLGFRPSQAQGPALEWAAGRTLDAQGFYSDSVVSRGPVSLMLVGGQQAKRLSSGSASGNVLSRFLAGAIGYGAGRWQAMAGMTAGWHDVAANRLISFPGFSEQGGSTYSVKSRRLDGEISYALSRGAIGVEPYAAVSNITIKTPSFDERGGTSALSFEKNVRSVNALTLGVRLDGKFEVDGVAVSPNLGIAMRHAWGDLDDRRSARFLEGSERFESVSSRFDEQSLAMDAGLDMKVGPVVVAGSYRGRMGRHWRDHSAFLNASLQF